MKKLIAFAIFAGFLPLSVFAGEPEWRAVISLFGEVYFGEVHTQIISSPFGQREGVCPRDETDGRKKCEEIFSRKWLRIIPSNNRAF